jgi:PTS system N-acetylglucosamine-specific IIC component
VKDLSKRDNEKLKKTNGVRGVFATGNAVQVVIGTNAEHVANEILSV